MCNGAARYTVVLADDARLHVRPVNLEKIGGGFRRLGATSVHMAAGSGASAINPRSSWLKHTCEGRVLYQDTAGRPGKCGYEVFSRQPPPEGVRAEGEVQRSKNFDESYVEASKNDAGILSPKSTWVKVTLAGDARIVYQDHFGGAAAEESPSSLRFPAAGIARELELPRGRADEFETLWKAAQEADASTASQWVKYISTGGSTTEKSYYHHSQTRAWSLEPPAEGAPAAVRRRFNTMENEFVLGRLAPGSVLGLNPVSDWGMIKCGDRAFYHNFETGVSSLKVPGEGWCETQEKPESVFERHYPPPARGAPFVHTPDPLSTLAEELVPEGDDRMLWFSMDEALRREMHALGPCERPEEVARWAKELSAGDVCDVNLTHATHPRTDTALFQIGNDTATVDTYLKRIGIASWIIHLRRHLPNKMGTVAEIRSVTADEIRQVAKDGKQDQVTESTISKVLKALEKEPRSLVWAAFTLDDRTLYQITGSRPLVNSRLEPKEGVRNTNVVPEKDKGAFDTNWEKAGRYDDASTPESRQRDVDSAVRQPLPKDKNIPRWCTGTVMSATSTHLTVSIDIASLKPALERALASKTLPIADQGYLSGGMRQRLAGPQKLHSVKISLSSNGRYDVRCPANAAFFRSIERGGGSVSPGYQPTEHTKLPRWQPRAGSAVELRVTTNVFWTPRPGSDEFMLPAWDGNRQMQARQYVNASVRRVGRWLGGSEVLEIELPTEALPNASTTGALKNMRHERIVVLANLPHGVQLSALKTFIGQPLGELEAKERAAEAAAAKEDFAAMGFEAEEIESAMTLTANSVGRAAEVMQHKRDLVQMGFSKEKVDAAMAMGGHSKAKAIQYLLEMEARVERQVAEMKKQKEASMASMDLVSLDPDRPTYPEGAEPGHWIGAERVGGAPLQHMLNAKVCLSSAPTSILGTILKYRASVVRTAGGTQQRVDTFFIKTDDDKTGWYGADKLRTVGDIKYEFAHPIVVHKPKTKLIFCAGDDCGHGTKELLDGHYHKRGKTAASSTDLCAECYGSLAADEKERYEKVAEINDGPEVRPYAIVQCVDKEQANRLVGLMDGATMESSDVKALLGCKLGTASRVAESTDAQHQITNGAQTEFETKAREALACPSKLDGRLVAYISTLSMFFPAQLVQKTLRRLWAAKPSLLLGRKVRVLENGPSHRGGKASSFHALHVADYVKSFDRFLMVTGSGNSGDPPAEDGSFLVNASQRNIAVSIGRVPIAHRHCLAAPRTFLRECAVCFNDSLEWSMFANFCFKKFRVLGDSEEISDPRHPGTICQSCLATHAATYLGEGRLFVPCPAEGCGRSLQTREVKDIVDPVEYDGLIQRLKESEQQKPFEELFVPRCPTKGHKMVWRDYRDGGYAPKPDPAPAPQSTEDFYQNELVRAARAASGEREEGARVPLKTQSLSNDPPPKPAAPGYRCDKCKTRHEFAGRRMGVHARWVCVECEDDYCRSCHGPPLEVRLCPKCNVRIEKNAGCDSMRCYRCAEQFRWGNAKKLENPPAERTSPPPPPGAATPAEDRPEAMELTKPVEDETPDQRMLRRQTDILTCFYKKHDPERSGAEHITAVLNERKGQQACVPATGFLELCRQLQQRYSESPCAVWRAAQANE